MTTPRGLGALAQAERLVAPARREADALDPTVWGKLARAGWRATMLALGAVLRACDGEVPRGLERRLRRLRELSNAAEGPPRARRRRAALPPIVLFYLDVSTTEELADAYGGHCPASAESVQWLLRYIEDRLLPRARRLCVDSGRPEHQRRRGT